jgi:hypothetical protein
MEGLGMATASRGLDPGWIIAGVRRGRTARSPIAPFQGSQIGV